MSYKRPNPGKREREAGKRHRRGGVGLRNSATEWKLLKLGQKHFMRWLSRSMCVADSRKQEAKTAKELLRQPIR
jgi:hypothetical protein